MAKQERPAGAKGQLPLGGGKVNPSPVACPCRANDHSVWVEKPHPRLRGVLETRCGKCGRWIGNRPAEHKR